MTHPIKRFNAEDLSHSNRRDFLKATATGAAGLLLTGTQASADATGKGWIDGHVHVWSSDLKNYPLYKGYKVEQMQPKSFTPEDILRHAKAEGVDRVVLIQMNFYEFDNSYMLKVIADAPKTFRGVAIIDDTKADAPQQMSSLLKRGVTGFRLYANKVNCEKWLTSEDTKRMWTKAADNGQAICLLANPDALPTIDQLCEKFPRTTVVIDHFARLGMTGTVEPNELENLKKLAKHSKVFVKTSAFYALGKKAPPYTDFIPMVLEMKKAFGAKRLLWASDCPFQVEKGHNYHDAIAIIRDRIPELTTEDKDWILRKTAEHVYWQA